MHIGTNGRWAEPKKNNKILKSNFKVIRSRSGLFRLKFFEIKYGYEGFDVRISFP
jgi:hypothetical protein